MNKQQRKEITEAFAGIDYDEGTITELSTAEAREGYAAEIDNLKDTLSEIKSDEENKYDNMPEGLQNGSKGEDIQNAISELESAMDSLEEAARIVRDDFPENASEEDIEAWVGEVNEKISDAESTATSI